MAKPSRIRRIALIVVAAPFALLLIAAVVAASLFLTFTDRWGKPTDFAAQHAALTRAHLGLGPTESGSTREWNDLQRDVTEVHAARVPNFVSPQGVTSWPSNIFDEDATPEDVALRSQLLADLEQRRIFQRLDDLARNPRVVVEPPANGTLVDLSPNLGSTRQLTRFLSWRVEDAVQRGDIDAALADLGRIDTIARLVGSTPSLIHHLTSIAVTAKAFSAAIAIAEAPTLRPEHGARLAALVNTTNVEGLEYAMKGERLIALGTIDATLSPHMFVSIDSRSQMRKVNELFDDFERQASLSIDELRAAKTEPEAIHRWGRIDRLRYVTAAILAPSVDGSRSTRDQIRLERVGTILAIAIHRYRLDHAGELPATLDALVPTYLAELPIDSFSGKPPIYVKGPVDVPQSETEIRDSLPATTASFMLYSVGFDATDNRGTLASKPRDAIRTKGAGTDYIVYPRKD